MRGARIAADRTGRPLALALAALVLLSGAPGAGASGAAAGADAGADAGAPHSGAAVERSAGAWTPARPDYAWSFPRDHWTHPGYRTEWWYFTGHLESTGAERRRFGYQLTFFRVGMLAETPSWNSAWATGDLVMGHAALTDISGGRHLYSELLYRAVPALGGFPEFAEPATDAGGGEGGDARGGEDTAPGSEGATGGLLAWSRGPAGTDSLWSVRWSGAGFDFEAEDAAAGFGFSLRTHPLKPLVLHGPNGFSRKGVQTGAASQYYSFTRLQTEGTVRVGGERFTVRGESWMDKEFGSGALGRHQSGWDWFGLRLADGRELMLYLLRGQAGDVDYARGTLVGPGGEASLLELDDFSVQTRGTWRSPGSGAVYPARWTVTVPGASPPIRIEVLPEMESQENCGTVAGGIFYWEGAVELRGPDGAPAGQGYVELTGYGGKRLPAM